MSDTAATLGAVVDSAPKYGQESGETIGEERRQVISIINVYEPSSNRLIGYVLPDFDHFHPIEGRREMAKLANRCMTHLTTHPGEKKEGETMSEAVKRMVQEMTG